MAFGFDAVSTGVMSDGLNVVETRSGILRASSTATMYDCDDVRLVVVVLNDMILNVAIFNLTQGFSTLRTSLLFFAK